MFDFVCFDIVFGFVCDLDVVMVGVEGGIG